MAEEILESPKHWQSAVIFSELEEAADNTDAQTQACHPEHVSSLL